MRLKAYFLFAATLSLAVSCGADGDEKSPSEPPEPQVSPYVTKVFDYMPAPGQFVNKYPAFESGDTQQTMREKALAAIGNGANSIVSLGAYGGYIVVGFDHTIENVEGKCDFRVLGNAYEGSSEPGIIMVSQDENANGQPDDKWYEIAGSSHLVGAKESWHQKAVDSGNDTNFFFRDFEISYSKPTFEPEVSEGSDSEEVINYISWTDNKGNEGSIPKMGYNTQSYFPQWISEETLTFKGSRLPQNGLDLQGLGKNFAPQIFAFGYADNYGNLTDGSAIDIAWAVDENRESVNLSGVDFIKIYNGVNQVNGWLGECSTEIAGVEDLHILGQEIDSNN